MVTITILDVQVVSDDNDIIIAQHAEIEISDGVDIYAWRIGNIPLGTDVQIYLDMWADELWLAASARAEAPNIYEHIIPKRLLKAVALVMMDEINILRGVAGLSPRTAKQVEEAVKGRLGD